MERIASIMYLNAGKEAEYKQKHDELWPDMEKALKEYGATNYSIFLEPKSRQLFAYLEVPDKAHYETFSQTEICQEWWQYMEPLMETNQDNSPVATDLIEVFHLS